MEPMAGPQRLIAMNTHVRGIILVAALAWLTVMAVVFAFS